MTKALIILLSVAMTWGLVALFGWISIPACFLLALGSLIFSTQPEDGETAQSNHQPRAQFFESPTTYMGSL